MFDFLSHSLMARAVLVDYRAVLVDYSGVVCRLYNAKYVCRVY